MKRVLIICLTLFFVTGLVFAGGTVDTTSAKDKVTIGWSLPTMEYPYLKVYVEAIKRFADELGWEVIITNSSMDINTQINNVEDLVSKGVDGLIINPGDTKALIPVIQKVYKETQGKMPIMTANVSTDPAQLPELKAFAGPSSYIEGRNVAAGVIKYLKEKGIQKINYIHMIGSEGYPAAVERENGWYDEIKAQSAQGMFNRLDRQPGGWTVDGGQQLMENFITRFGSQIQLVYCHNDAMAIGVWNAIEAAGIEPGKILVIGVDGMSEILKLIDEGKVFATCYQSPTGDAKLTLDVMQDILDGKKVEFLNYLDTPFVTKKNVKEFLPGEI